MLRAISKYRPPNSAHIKAHVWVRPDLLKSSINVAFATYDLYIRPCSFYRNRSRCDFCDIRQIYIGVDRFVANRSVSPISEVISTSVEIARAGSFFTTVVVGVCMIGVSELIESARAKSTRLFPTSPDLTHHGVGF